MYPEDELLPLSALVDITFCARRAALHHIERVWEDNAATAEGHGLHDKVHAGGEESRGDLRISRGVRIRSLALGITGVADVVEFHRVPPDGSGVVLPDARGRWLPFPIEYKRGIKRHEISFEVQLCAQAMCLEEMLNCSIPGGALFYGLSRRRQDVLFSDDLRRKTEDAASRLHALLKAGITPPACFDKRCKRCSLLDVCIPGLTGKRITASRYVQDAMDSINRQVNKGLLS